MTSSNKVAVYAGSFDPLTKGHEDIIRRAADTFGRFIVGVAVNPRKETLFTPEERVTMIKETLPDLDITVVSFKGLLVDFLKKENARIVIRGLRALSDFDYEFQMALINHKLLSEVDTFLLMSNEKYIFLSSSIIKEIAMLGGDVSQMVSEPVQEMLEVKRNTIVSDHL